ncbi:MAG: hypothetical protein ABI543_03610 [Ignavibacteria bacterium]
MSKFIKYCKLSYQRIANSPFVRYNSPKQNILILLFGGILVMAAFDLSSELAKEKGEIDSVIAVMENSVNQQLFTELPSFKLNIEEFGIILTYNTPIQTNDVLTLPRDRAPPII